MVKITIDARETANSVITLVALLLISLGITGIIMIIAGPTVNILENYYVTRGLPITFFGYKFTRKYYGKYNDNKERLKQWLLLH